MSLTTELRVEMARKSFTIASLARASGLSRQLLSSRLNGHTDFTYGELGQIAEVLGITVSELARRAELAPASQTPAAA